ncbi:sugar kinase [Psychromonas sp. MB-3u-54]|uniref:ROK family protein n=1 Tax=Psychromonas sp. MB-3u-54 TaxID=2058319 RepID=UPI000C340327|nr:ROK family protein [Psychromonas sp. MB-3u-54]PKH04563.1 sugar kinase [Psychromonas sp. MB-3u-54]
MILGLDIGGTKIEGVGLDSVTFETLVTLRNVTHTETYEGFLLSVRSVIDEVAKHGNIESIGIGCCGSVDKAGLMQGANLVILNGQNFIGDITKNINVPVAIANDADCLALSEFKDGAAKEAQNSCVAIIIGTGCGSGLIVHNKLVTGLNNLGGELGHNPLPNYLAEVDGSEVLCYCGSKNCTEAFVSGTGFARTFSAKYHQANSKEIMHQYKQGDSQAVAHLDLYCDQLARVCANIVNFVDPDVIVLGGGISNIDEIYPLLNAKLNQYTFTKNTVTKIVKNVYGDSSGVRGAAFLHLQG